MNVMLITNNAKRFEYKINSNNVKECVSIALNEYIEDTINANKNFTAPMYLWKELKYHFGIITSRGELSSNDFVKLVNGLIKSEKNRINQIIVDYTYYY